MAKISFKSIEVTAWKGQQSIYFRKIANLGEFKIKIEIKRDSYDHQSHAIGFVFSMTTLEWKTIYSIPYPEMKTKEGLMYGQEAISAAMFSTDSERVMTGITSILF